MKLRRLLALAACTAALALASFALQGCSDDDDDYTTNPPPGGGFNSGTLNAGASYQRTFANADTIGYHCTFHRTMGMVGTIQVATGGPDSALVTASGMVFAPATAVVKPGGSIRWVIATGQHTVTQD